MKVVISSGHAKNCRGATGFLDEVDEARKVVNRVAEFFAKQGTKCEVFHDDVSTTQNENLNRIVNFHNGETRDLDVSVQFNAYETTQEGMGTECLYVTQHDLAAKVTALIGRASELIDRGAKKRTDLFFLNKTKEPAILIEVCFVDSWTDADTYRIRFDAICGAIAEAITGAPAEVPSPAPEGTFTVTGKASTFGGPDDKGVSPSEGLAFISKIEQAPHLFLPYQPSGTTGLARRLNPCVHYVACRWDYSKTPKEKLLEREALVRRYYIGGDFLEMKAFPADWGPNETTGRVADLSPTLMDDLGIKTDDEVEVTFPA